MPEPILWTITESVKTALEAIDGTGTYFYTATTVAYATNEQQTFGRGTFILRLTDTTREGDETQGKYYWRATYDVTAMVAPSDSIPDIQALMRLFSHVQTAVMADPQRTVSATKYAIDTQVIAPEFRDGYDERTGMTCQVEVYYRNSITAPTSL